MHSSLPSRVQVMSVLYTSSCYTEWLRLKLMMSIYVLLVWARYHCRLPYRLSTYYDTCIHAPAPAVKPQLYGPSHLIRHRRHDQWLCITYSRSWTYPPFSTRAPGVYIVVGHYAMRTDESTSPNNCRMSLPCNMSHAAQCIKGSGRVLRRTASPSSDSLCNPESSSERNASHEHESTTVAIEIAIGHVLPREHLMNKIFHVDVSSMSALGLAMGLLFPAPLTFNRWISRSTCPPAHDISMFQFESRSGGKCNACLEFASELETGCRGRRRRENEKHSSNGQRNMRVPVRSSLKRTGMPPRSPPGNNVVCCPYRSVPQFSIYLHSRT
ncbi:hypothetical protein C8Q74DRAFT_203335 [Fomes fomentarius]|nr:hypothetical protein C8Q74DRAFT_203335 [Fomes fomentarius]